MPQNPDTNPLEVSGDIRAVCLYASCAQDSTHRNIVLGGCWGSYGRLHGAGQTADRVLKGLLLLARSFACTQAQSSSRKMLGSQWPFPPCEIRQHLQFFLTRAMGTKGPGPLPTQTQNTPLHSLSLRSAELASLPSMPWDSPRDFN